MTVTVQVTVPSGGTPEATAPARARILVRQFTGRRKNSTLRESCTAMIRRRAEVVRQTGALEIPQTLPANSECGPAGLPTAGWSAVPLPGRSQPAPQQQLPCSTSGHRPCRYPMAQTNPGRAARAGLAGPPLQSGRNRDFSLKSALGNFGYPDHPRPSRAGPGSDVRANGRRIDFLRTMSGTGIKQGHLVASAHRPSAAADGPHLGRRDGTPRCSRSVACIIPRTVIANDSRQATCPRPGAQRRRRRTMGLGHSPGRQRHQYRPGHGGKPRHGRRDHRRSRLPDPVLPLLTCWVSRPTESGVAAMPRIAGKSHAKRV